MSLCIGHRGEPRGHRENTLPAIEAAVAAGADLVEIDVRLTADSVPVLLHDATLERLWGDPRPVDQLTLDQVRALGSGQGVGPGGDSRGDSGGGSDGDSPGRSGVDATEGLRIPTFEEALELAERLDTPLVVDVTETAFGLAAYEIVARRDARRLALFCGSTAALEAIRARDPDVAIAMTWAVPEPPSEEIWERVRPQYFNPAYALLDAAVVRGVHDRGIGVCTWTVDDRATMRDLLELGVDAIISNRIATLVAVVRDEPLLEPAQPQDAPALAELWDAAARWLHASGIDQWEPGGFDADAFAASIERDEVLVVRRSGRLAATVTLAREQPAAWVDEPARIRPAYVRRLIVADEHRGAGLGSAVLAAAERRARDSGASVVRLDCLDTNLGLRAYYERLGYRDAGAREFTTALGYYPCRLFEKELDTR